MVFNILLFDETFLLALTSKEEENLPHRKNINNLLLIFTVLTSKLPIFQLENSKISIWHLRNVSFECIGDKCVDLVADVFCRGFKQRKTEREKEDDDWRRHDINRYTAKLEMLLWLFDLFVKICEGFFHNLNANRNTININVKAHLVFFFQFYFCFVFIYK